MEITTNSEVLIIRHVYNRRKWNQNRMTEPAVAVLFEANFVHMPSDTTVTGL